MVKVCINALTTSLGLLLLLFATGNEIQRPLPAVVIGGLFTLTILTLLSVVFR